MASKQQLQNMAFHKTMHSESKFPVVNMKNRQKVVEERDRFPTLAKDVRVGYNSYKEQQNGPTTGGHFEYRVLDSEKPRHDINLKKRSILGRRTLGRTPGVRSNSAIAPTNKNRLSQQNQQQNQLIQSISTPDIRRAPNGYLYQADKVSDQMSAQQKTYPKRAGKSKVRLTLLDVASFLPKPVRLKEQSSSKTSSQGDLLKGNAVLPLQQKDVVVDDKRLLPSRPSFVELRQMRNQIIKSNLQRTQAWMTRDLTDVIDISDMTNYCDQDKTSMIMSWLNDERPKSKSKSVRSTPTLQEPQRL